MANTIRSEYIQGLALSLFDQTEPLHELNEQYRQVLSMAALMVDESQNLNKKKASKAIRSLAKAKFGDEIASENEELLVPVLTLETDLVRRKEILASDLSPIQQRAAFTLAALLKIAVGLDASDTQSTEIVQVEPARNEIWIVVQGDQAQVDGESAEAYGKLWEKIGYPKINVLESEEAARMRDVHAKVPDLGPVTAVDTLAEAGKKVMSKQLLAVLQHEQDTRKGEDIEALHDMRVATRRLRAALKVFKEAYRPKRLKPLLNHLRQTGAALGRVRDLDVSLEKIHKYQIERNDQNVSNGLEPLLNALQKQRDQARSEMIVYLDSNDYKNFKESFSKFLVSPDAGVKSSPKSNPTPNMVRDLAPALIYERLAAVRAFDRAIPDASVEQLHALRIQFKQLRYTIEYFREALGPEAGEIIDDLKKNQDHLGDLNDARLAVENLQDFLKAHSKKSKGESPLSEQEVDSITYYLEYRAQERDQLKNSFPELWEHFNSPDFIHKIALVVSVL